MSLKIRPIEPEDLDDATIIVHKFWSLSSEFEPTIDLREKTIEEIKRNIRRSMGREDQIVLVAEAEGEKGLVGFLRAEIREGPFYGSKPWGHIEEFYVLPHSRRKTVGKELLETALQKLEEANVKSVAAEFPTQNVPAVGFYERNGFRPYLTVYMKELE